MVDYSRGKIDGWKDKEVTREKGQWEKRKKGEIHCLYDPPCGQLLVEWALNVNERRKLQRRWDFRLLVLLIGSNGHSSTLACVLTRHFFLVSETYTDLEFELSKFNCEYQFSDRHSLGIFPKLNCFCSAFESRYVYWKILSYIYSVFFVLFPLHPVVTLLPLSLTIELNVIYVRDRNYCQMIYI